MLPRWLVIALAILISIMWSANLIIGWQYPGRSEPSLNAIFAIVAGMLVASNGAKATLQAGRRKIARILDPKGAGDDQGDRGGQS